MIQPARPRVHRAPGGATVLEETVGLELSMTEITDDLLSPFPDLLGTGPKEPFRYCLNTSTLRGHNLSLSELVDIAAGAGYEAIEPWIDEIEKFAAEGGDLRDLKSRINDLGITVESGIGFFEWIVADEDRRKKGFEDARHAMGLLARLGGKRVAAPPWGAHGADAPPVNLLAAVDYYRDLCNLGEQIGVAPQLEVWGFSKNLSRMGEAALILAECDHPDACILADVYHLYKGGSPVGSLGMFNGDMFKVFHVNDYPAIAPETIKDADRVFPGDGIAPLTSILRNLRHIGFEGVLSLELFNEDYYKQEPLTVAREGREKLRDVIMRAL